MEKALKSVLSKEGKSQFFAKCPHCSAVQVCETNAPRLLNVS